jgi:hypothetical protein
MEAHIVHAKHSLGLDKMLRRRRFSSMGELNLDLRETTVRSWSSSPSSGGTSRRPRWRASPRLGG